MIAMMRKKWNPAPMLALMLALALVLMMASLCACSDEEGSEGAAGSGVKKKAAGMSIKVDESTGKMSIERPKIKDPAPMGEPDTWTIFVYLCGSDLESRLLFGGAASSDIKEMCKATASEDVRFVVETGGSEYWHNTKIDSDTIGRFVVEKGKLKPLGEKKLVSMGKASTLSDFLIWGIQKYPAEHMGVVFWDHGGGSIAGVCFDETKEDDSLTLREIDAGMLSCLESGGLTDRFEFIGFDACLMGTVETANVAASYADYMIGSQESEPGSGWDYTAIGNYLARHPDADGAQLGKEVCDSFRKQCESAGDGQIATLSVIDLSKMDPLLKHFNTFSEEMYEKSEKKKTLTKMVRKITAVDNFGGNNKAEGYTNMVDLGCLITACKGWSDAAQKAKSTLDKAVVYKISGSDHQKATGLSVYYPLAIGDSQEMQVFESVCVSPYYMSFVGRQGFGSVNDGDTEGYSEDEEIFEGGFWNWLDTFLFDEETGDYEFDTQECEGDWDYFDEHEEGAQSELITFEEEPGFDEDGNFSFVLDDNGYENTSDVLALVYEELEDGSFLELGETYDVDMDWESGYGCDNFDGYWLSLPDGQNLATYIVDVTKNYIVYTAPILLNGEETYLRMRQSFDSGKVSVEGAWEGINECGASAKDIVKLQKGDEIVPMYYSIDEQGEDLVPYEGEPYTVKAKKGEKKGQLKIGYDYMYAGDYAYAFCITDVYGDDYISDLAEFQINERGEISYYEN